MKMPVIYSVRSHSAYDRASYIIGANHTFRQHGQAHGGIAGSEFLSGDSSTTGMELCAIVERMQSDEEAQMILTRASVTTWRRSPSTPCPARYVSVTPMQGSHYEAEDAALTRGAIRNNDHHRYQGTGFADFRRSTLATVTFNNVAAPADGVHKIIARYSAGMLHPEGVQMIVNGAPLAKVTLPSTGAWNYWQDSAPWIASLQAGANNTIQFMGSNPPFNLDCITVVPILHVKPLSLPRCSAVPPWSKARSVLFSTP